MNLPNDIASCHRIILDLVSIIEGFKPQLEGYVQENNQLELRVKEMESQLHQNSRNSNCPFRWTSTRRIEETEHQVLDWVCSGCKSLNQGQFPSDVCSNTQYVAVSQNIGLTSYLIF